MKYLRIIIGSLLLALLVACGGGGGSAGTTPGSTSGETTTPTTTATSTITSTVADFIFELDKTSIANSGSDKAVLTVTAVNAARNVVANAPVSVSVDADAVFSANTSTTDASGKFVGNITIGGNKSDRTITATIKVNNLTKVASIRVVGSKISFSTVPATPVPGQSVTLNISTSDSAGNPIPDVTIALNGTAGVIGTLTANISGNQLTTFIAPVVEGTYTVVVSGLGVSTTKIIQVVVPGAASIPAAIGPVSSVSLNPQPTSISPNTAGSTTNRAKLSAKFLTTGNAGLKNMRVRFEIVAPVLGNGESISTGDAAVYTDASGVAEADYIPGTRSSPTNGVTVRACYKLTDFTSTSDCPFEVPATLTVAGNPLSISISHDNTMSKGLGGIAYIKKFLIQVNDAAGVAVKDAIVSTSVDITHYGKGSNWSSDYLDVEVPSITDFHSDLNLPAGFISSLQASTYTPGTNEKIWCINEDRNRNGSLDIGEDRNSDGVVQPRKAEIIVSYVNGNRTDLNGQMLVQISYGQNMGRWLAYTLRATTAVAGSEGDASKNYVTNVIQDDVVNGSFLTPPFGVGACNASN